MASSLGIGCGGSKNVVMGRVRKFSLENQCNLSLRPTSLTIPRHCVGCRGRVSTTMTAAKAMAAARSSMDLAAYGKLDETGRLESEMESGIAYERLDEWMRDSVVEIVKNLREAPLLVHVYQKKKSDNGETPTLKTEEKAVEEDWPVVQKNWETGENPLPEGLIFVEELGAGDDSEKEEREEGRGGDGGGRSETTTRAWGIVVQGKGVRCGPVCYLLKTSRVGAGGGLGLCCTHFCLVRVKSFRETVYSQLKNSWLLQGQ